MANGDGWDKYGVHVLKSLEVVQATTLRMDDRLNTIAKAVADMPSQVDYRRLESRMDGLDQKIEAWGKQQQVIETGQAELRIELRTELRNRVAIWGSAATIIVAVITVVLR